MLIISDRSKDSLCGCISNENLIFFPYPAQFVRQSPLELMWRSSASYGQHATILFVPVVHLQSLTIQCSLQPSLCRPQVRQCQVHTRENSYAFPCVLVYLLACSVACFCGYLHVSLSLFFPACFLAWQLHDCLLTCLLACLLACLLVSSFACLLT